MAHYYGKLQGARGMTTRCGTKKSGIWANVKSWGSQVTVELADRDGIDQYTIGVEADASGVLLVINGEEFVYFKGKVYKERHEVLGEIL